MPHDTHRHSHQIWIALSAVQVYVREGVRDRYYVRACDYLTFIGAPEKDADVQGGVLNPVVDNEHELTGALVSTFDAAKEAYVDKRMVNATHANPHSQARPKLALTPCFVPVRVDLPHIPSSCEMGVSPAAAAVICKSPIAVSCDAVLQCQRTRSSMSAAAAGLSQLLRPAPKARGKSAKPRGCRWRLTSSRACCTPSPASPRCPPTSSPRRARAPRRCAPSSRRAAQLLKTDS